MTLSDLTEKILVLAGRTDLPACIPNRAMDEVREQWVSSQRASERLGWKPWYTLDEGLGPTIGRYRKYFTHDPGSRQ